MENTLEVDFSRRDADEINELIKKIAVFNAPRLIIKNVSEFMEGSGFSMFQLAYEKAMADNGYFVNFGIHGIGTLARGIANDYIDEDDFHGYCTAIYYPLDDKIVAVLHSTDLK